MSVASPYAVFRAADLLWAAPPRPLAQGMARSLPIGSPFVAAPQPCSSPRPRPRKRLAPVGVIQGELFVLQRP